LKAEGAPGGPLKEEKKKPLGKKSSHPKPSGGEKTALNSNPVSRKKKEKKLSFSKRGGKNAKANLIIYG